MKVEDIIYQTTRELINLEDKLRIATLFIFCESIGTRKIAELLYCDCFQTFIDNLSEDYKNYGVDFIIRMEDKNVSNAFFKTIEVYKEKNDKTGFYKAVYENDPYAIAILDIVSDKLDKLDILKVSNKINKQLSLF